MDVDNDGGEPDDDGDAAAEMNNKPQTKAELSKMIQKFQNTLHLVAHLYHDRDLQDELRLVASITKPYLDEYVAALDHQKSGQVGGQWQFDFDVSLIKHVCLIFLCILMQ